MGCVVVFLARLSRYCYGGSKLFVDPSKTHTNTYATHARRNERVSTICLHERVYVYHVYTLHYRTDHHYSVSRLARWAKCAWDDHAALALVIEL